MAAPSFGGHEPVKSYVVGLPRIVAKICQIICDVSFLMQSVYPEHTTAFLCMILAGRDFSVCSDRLSQSTNPQHWVA